METVCVYVCVVNLQGDNQMECLIEATPEGRTGYDLDLQPALELVSGDLQVSRIRIHYSTNS